MVNAFREFHDLELPGSPAGWNFFHRAESVSTTIVNQGEEWTRLAAFLSKG